MESAALGASYQCVLRFFHSTCVKYCACHENWCQVIRRAAPVTQNHLSKPEDLMLQNATPLRKSAPWPPNISDEHVFCTALATRIASLKILFKCPTPASVFGNATKPWRFAHFCQGTRSDIWTSKSAPYPSVFLHFWLLNVLRATTACTFSTSQLPKAVRHWGVLYIFTSKCASCHNGVHFFDISTAKRSDTEVFCTFWLRNVLRATTACTFSTSQLPTMLWNPGVLYILTCTCASRHNGVQFFISHLASWLRTRRFSEPTFRPSGAPNHWKNTMFRDFPTFSRICTFFLLTLPLLLFFLLIFLFSLPLPCSAFHLSILSEAWLLNFLRLQVLGTAPSMKDKTQGFRLFRWVITLKTK